MTYKFEEEGIKAYIWATSVTLRSPQHEPGVFYFVYLTETGNTDPIALDDIRNDKVTLLYDVDETLKRLRLYGLEPLEGVRYREYRETEKPWELDLDFGDSKYLEMVKPIYEKRGN